MEWNSKKAGVEIDKDMDTESLCNSFESGSSSRNTFVSAASLPLGNNNKLDKNFIGMEKISGRSGESSITSELGKQQVYGSAPASSIPATKRPRSRASYQKMQNPSCQVEGCYRDLSLAKDYHRRHRICEIHSKSPRVIVTGMERRFCQQCSRFHGLSEFDDKKRSCRRRLSDHNARRRRMQPESIHFSSPGLPSSLYERRSQNVLLNSNGTGENICNSTLIRPSKTGETYRRWSLPNDEIPSAVHHVEPERLFSLESRNPRVLDQYLPSASSLLSIDSHWSLNRDESTCMEGLNSRVDDPNWSSNHVQVAADEGPAVSTNLHHSGITLLQEFDLFKTPYLTDSACFHSNDRRNL